MDKVQLHIMTSIINRIIELAGWIVLGVSVILLGVASHIDNYQPPEPVTVAQPKYAVTAIKSDIICQLLIASPGEHG